MREEIQQPAGVNGESNYEKLLLKNAEILKNTLNELNNFKNQINQKFTIFTSKILNNLFKNSSDDSLNANSPKQNPKRRKNESNQIKNAQNNSIPSTSNNLNQNFSNDDLEMLKLIQIPKLKLVCTVESDGDNIR